MLARFCTIFPRLVLDLVFPRRCAGCRAPGSFLCGACTARMKPVRAPFCQVCGRPLRGGSRCGICRAVSLHIDGIRSVYIFEGVTRRAVHRFKYDGLQALGAPLGEHMARHLLTHPLGVAGLVPVPLHPTRLRERGYNQAEILARAIARHTALPVYPAALRRVRRTPAQVRTSGYDERRANVAGAFAAGPPLPATELLLIDDVCTTGSTLDACAEALKAAGARQVWGLTLAREA